MDDPTQTLFKDSNVDPAELNDADYAQKRLLLLKTSRALMSSESFEGEDDSEPAILTIQNSIAEGSSQWEGSSAGMPDEMPHLAAIGSLEFSSAGGRRL